MTSPAPIEKPSTIFHGRFHIMVYLYYLVYYRFIISGQKSYRQGCSVYGKKHCVVALACKRGTFG